MLKQHNVSDNNAAQLTCFGKTRTLHPTADEIPLVLATTVHQAISQRLHHLPCPACQECHALTHLGLDQGSGCVAAQTPAAGPLHGGGIQGGAHHLDAAVPPGAAVHRRGHHPDGAHHPQRRRTVEKQLHQYPGVFVKCATVLKLNLSAPAKCSEDGKDADAEVEAMTLLAY